MPDKVVQQWPKGKDSNTLKKSSHRRHSRWSLNLTALNSCSVSEAPLLSSLLLSAPSPLHAPVYLIVRLIGALILSHPQQRLTHQNSLLWDTLVSVWMQCVKSQTPQMQRQILHSRLVCESEWHPVRIYFCLSATSMSKNRTSDTSFLCATPNGVAPSWPVTRHFSPSGLWWGHGFEVFNTRDPIVHRLWPGHLLCPSDSQTGQAAEPVSPESNWTCRKNKTQPSVPPWIYFFRDWEDTGRTLGGPILHTERSGTFSLSANHLGGTRVM